MNHIAISKKLGGASHLVNGIPPAINILNTWNIPYYIRDDMGCVYIYINHRS